MKTASSILPLIGASMCIQLTANAFTTMPAWKHVGHRVATSVSASTTPTQAETTSPVEHISDADIDEVEEVLEQVPQVVTAPLQFLGPYPALALRFPGAATASQRARNVSGISLDFVVDTAANLNTINGQVAQELQWDVVGESMPGASTSGAMPAGQTYDMGNAQLEHGPDKIFMQNLTASALPVASPANSAGLLSLAFLYCFEGGVELQWESTTRRDEQDGSVIVKSPSITFYGSDKDAAAALEGKTRIPIHPIPVTLLPSVTVEINGVQMPALLDTGSPITVLNTQAAKQAGIETIALPSSSETSKNPFANMANKFKEANAMAKAAANGDVLAIAGANGQPVYLAKSTQRAAVEAVGEDDSDSKVSFEEGSVYVGDIPGLAALNGLGVDAPPAVVLGMDVLRRRPSMFLNARNNKVYF